MDDRWLALAAVLAVGCGSGGGDASMLDAGDANVGEGSIDSAIDAAIDSSARDGASDATDDSSADAPTDAPVDGDGGPVDYPLPPIPSTCTRVARVITYDPNGWATLVDAMEATHTVCGDYFIHLPAITSDKTLPRGPLQPAAIRARKGRFFAVAEFQFAAWSARTDLSWYDKGVEFRKRMDAANYEVSRGDTWAINELPSSVRSDATVRTHVMDLVRGLYTGPAGSKPVGGIVWTIDMGHETTTLDVYKTNMEDWTTDGAFWDAMNSYVRFWGQEVYASAPLVCVGGETTAARAQHVNDFTMHPAILANASGAPSSASSARAFFGESYFPLLTAYWQSDGPYGTTTISLDEMKKHVSLQTYATRAWAEANAYPDGRIGFAWDESAGTATDRADLAARLAASIANAYDPGATPSYACSPSGAFTWCDCVVAGAAFDEAWKTFATW